MKYLIPTLALALVAVCNLGHAQERSAGGSIQGDVTWASLNGQLSNIRGKIDGANLRVTQLVTCGRKGKVYGPDGVDSDKDEGCISAKPKAVVGVNPDITALKNYVANIINCGASNYFFNGGSCVAAVYAPAAAYRWVASGGAAASLRPCGGAETVGAQCTTFPNDTCRSAGIVTRTVCMGNQCNGMGYSTSTTYNRLICN